MRAALLRLLFLFVALAGLPLGADAGATALVAERSLDAAAYCGAAAPGGGPPASAGGARVRCGSDAAEPRLLLAQARTDVPDEVGAIRPTPHAPTFPLLEGASRQPDVPGRAPARITGLDRPPKRG